MNTSPPAAFSAADGSPGPLHVITCGSEGDGKSTLVDRLLADAGAEREQGLPNDPASRGFSTRQRSYLVADAPGRAQHTRDLLSAASTADAAVLLVDACAGLRTQTRRHALIAALAGIRHVVLAINKMDSVGFDRARYDDICHAFASFALSLDFVSVTTIPLSAAHGDNLVQRSARTPWYDGPTLLVCLESLDAAPPPSRFVFPVQGIGQPGTEAPGFSGTVAEGSIRVGDQIRVTASGQTARVAEIIAMDGPLPVARRGDAVTLRMDAAIDAARGDVLSLAQAPLETTDQFEATLVWMDEDAGLVGRSYDIELATQRAQASLTAIKHRIDVDTLAHEASRKLALDDIAVCNLATSKALCFDTYTASHALGGFILVDRYTRATVAAGMIRHSLRRAQNVHKQALAVARKDRERLNGHAGKVVWFTGLSGSGKSTLANALEVALHEQGLRTYILDGDNVRQGLNKDLGFTDADRVENIRRIAEVARLMLDAGLIVMTAFISPFRRERDMARELIGTEHFVEVFVDTPLEVCEGRDPKGLYKKARSGQLPNMTGIGSPYEAPEHPDVVIAGASGDLRAAVAQLATALGVGRQPAAER
ncbi:adenylyl-sulfate kinase [Azoarcus sp. DD4]|uniref:adenylyl-sulfate kinase n=1 Tax=Azoarcus sp. DD4 TaxID=2027405 RepID=UPI001128A61F|nr:adenylyl-sulfate kinase [Azoarcus sp. DD4]QDF98961.1 adenylyl-sulfate kinase [Azoarcus sp. DD4]